MVQADRLEYVKIANVVEIQIEQRPIMLAGCDENRRFAAPKEVVWVPGMKGDGPNVLTGKRHGEHQRRRHTDDWPDPAQNTRLVK